MARRGIASRSQQRLSIALGFYDSNAVAKMRMKVKDAKSRRAGPTLGTLLPLLEAADVFAAIERDAAREEAAAVKAAADRATTKASEQEHPRTDQEQDPGEAQE